jgi:hypothetical protein
MNIIRDDETFGIMMIPLLHDWGIRRCNIKDCTEKPTTIISAVENVPVFGMCEKHYQESKESGKLDCKLIFDDFDAFHPDCNQMCLLSEWDENKPRDCENCSGRIK